MTAAAAAAETWEVVADVAGGPHLGAHPCARRLGGGGFAVRFRSAGATPQQVKRDARSAVVSALGAAGIDVELLTLRRGAAGPVLDAGAI